MSDRTVRLDLAIELIRFRCGDNDADSFLKVIDSLDADALIARRAPLGDQPAAPTSVGDPDDAAYAVEQRIHAIDKASPGYIARLVRGLCGKSVDARDRLVSAAKDLDYLYLTPRQSGSSGESNVGPKNTESALKFNIALGALREAERVSAGLDQPAATSLDGPHDASGYVKPAATTTRGTDQHETILGRMAQPAASETPAKCAACTHPLTDQRCLNAKCRFYYPPVSPPVDPRIVVGAVVKDVNGREWVAVDETPWLSSLQGHTGRALNDSDVFSRWADRLECARHDLDYVERDAKPASPPASPANVRAWSDGPFFGTPDKRERGLHDKFVVSRTDGSSAKGAKHDGCDYFVLDLTHDPHAKAAILAYADSAEKDGFGPLARDLRAKFPVPVASPARSERATHVRIIDCQGLPQHHGEIVPVTWRDGVPFAPGCGDSLFPLPPRSWEPVTPTPAPRDEAKASPVIESQENERAILAMERMSVADKVDLRAMTTGAAFCYGWLACARARDGGR